MRPGDWSPLGLSSDPVPGDPSTVAAGGRDYLDVADAIGSAKNTLHTIDLGDFVVSEAVDALQDTAHKVADSIGKAEARYRAAGEALIAYAPVLEQAQTDSASALALARSATEAADGADQQRRHYLHLSTTESDPAQALQYKNLADTSESDAADAQRTLTAAQDQLSQATSARDRAAESAIDGIHAITEHDGLHDSWWDNWGKNLVEAITDIAGWVSSIAGVLALCVCWIPVVGQALAAALLIVAGVAAIVNAIGNVVLAATGDRSWTTALISIAGAVLAVVGLGGAVRVVGNVAAAARINARAALEVGATDATRLTASQAIRLRPSVLAQSEKLWAKPVATITEDSTVYRLYGGAGEDAAKATGASYGTMDPRAVANPREVLGLPDQNAADRLIVGEVTDPSKAVVTRHALPLDGNPGGAPEYIFPGEFGPGKGVQLLTDTPFQVR